MAQDSELRLNVSNANSGNGALVDMANCRGDASQLWQRNGNGAAQGLHDCANVSAGNWHWLGSTFRERCSTAPACRTRTGSDRNPS
jgi:hypothetical protein